MREYLSFGAGVNSTALMLLLLDEGRDFEAIFVDLGCEHPETYQHIQILKGNGYEITTLKPNVKGYDNLYDFLYSEKIVPFIKYRSCTDKFKIQTLKKHFERPCISYIGFSADEYRRSFGSYKTKNITEKYPLIEKRLTRSHCKEIIKEHGLEVPVKSGCWFCPFQSLDEWKKLRANHPDLFKKAIELDENATITNGLLKGRMPLSALWQEEKLTDFPGFTTPIEEIMTKGENE